MGHFVLQDSQLNIIYLYILIDTYREESRGEDKIGTTKRGIGPCYEDRVARTGIQAVDLLFPDIFRLKDFVNCGVVFHLLNF